MDKHFTASTFVVDSRNRVLLMWHKRLERWMPPGGHVDENELPEETAKRECKEETGLDVEIVGDTQPDVFGPHSDEGRMMKKPFAMLLENIPASPSRGEPAHLHMDFLYRAKPVDEGAMLTMQPDEMDELRWFTLEEIDAIDDAKIFKNVRTYIRLLASAKN